METVEVEGKEGATQRRELNLEEQGKERTERGKESRAASHYYH